jgi:hypothetical protein
LSLQSPRRHAQEMENPCCPSGTLALIPKCTGISTGLAARVRWPGTAWTKRGCSLLWSVLKGGISICLGAECPWTSYLFFCLF